MIRGSAGGSSPNVEREFGAAGRRDGTAVLPPASPAVVADGNDDVGSVAGIDLRLASIDVITLYVCGKVWLLLAWCLLLCFLPCV